MLCDSTDLTPVFFHHLFAPLISASTTRLVELRVGGSLIGVHVNVSWTECRYQLMPTTKFYNREREAISPPPTCRKPSSKENVEELLWGNVSLEISVEGSIVARVSAAGVFGCAESCRLVSVLIVLLPLLGVAQHGVRVADCCGRRLGTRQALTKIQAESSLIGRDFIHERSGL